MKKNNFIIFGVILFLVTASTVFTIISFKKELAKKHLPVYGQIKNFSLIDTQGRAFGLKNLKNKVWIADFIFTTCGSICPVMTKNMASLFRSFDLEKDLEFVSITVNPENDSAEVLARYAKEYEADTAQWHFLTGSRDDIKKLSIESFKIGSIKDPIFHSSKFVLVDKHGIIRGYYEGTDNKEISKLFRDAAKLLKNGW